MLNIKVLIIFTFLIKLVDAQTDYSKDLDTFSDSLTTKHKNLFANISKELFDNRIEKTRQLITSGGLDRQHFIIQLMKINAQIADEHTMLFPLSTNKFPFGFYFFSEGVFLIYSDSSHRQYLLNELVAIDSIPINEIIDRFKTCIKTDNESYFNWLFAIYLSNQDFLKGLDIIHNTDSAIFSFKNNEGVVNNIIVEIKPNTTRLLANTGKRKQLRYSQHKNYWFSFDTSGKILYFNYENCEEDKTISFNEFNKELFKAIKKKKPSTIVLDLRQNSGGKSAILSPFIERIKDSYLNSPGKFFVLIGRQTFSSALLNALELKQKTSAIFIGEPTGGNINHYGEVRQFSLPDSKTVVYYSTNYFEHWKGKQGGLLPDYTIPDSVKDRFENKDSCMEIVYQLYK